jgi:hypothetical protein
MSYLNKFLLIDIDNFTQSMIEFSDLIVKNIKPKGTIVSRIVTSANTALFSDEIISTINQKLILFNSQLSIVSTQFLLLLAEIQSEKSTNKTYQKFFNELSRSSEYDKIYRKDLPLNEIEEDVENLSNEMTKSNLTDEMMRSSMSDLKKLPVIQKTVAPGFTGDMQESPFCQAFGSGRKRKFSKKYKSRKSFHRSSRRYRKSKN